MKVSARDTSTEEIPPGIVRFSEQSPDCITNGKEYDVHAMAMFEGILFHQIVDDFKWPTWLPDWHFRPVDRTIPDDWISNTFHGGPLTFVIGPSFVSSSESSYAEMVELEPKQVKRFWRRVESLAKRCGDVDEAQDQESTESK